jgi:hypothetical protein
MAFSSTAAGFGKKPIQRENRMPTPTYVDVIPSFVELSGRKHLVNVVILDGEDGLLSNQIEEIFGYSQFQMRVVINTMQLSSTKIVGQSLSVLQSEGLLSSRATQSLFVARDSLRKIIEEIGSGAHASLYRSIWAPFSSKVPNRSVPKKNLRTALIQTARRQSERIRNLELEVSELRAIVEDLLRDDMNRKLSALCAPKASPREPLLYSGTGVSSHPRCQFPLQSSDEYHG